MKRFKGTPSPWHVDNLITVAINSGCKHVAVVNLSEKVNKDESNANAHLIAAAPELLEILIECRGWLGLCKELQDKVDLAISKALGDVQ